MKLENRNNLKQVCIPEKAIVFLSQQTDQLFPLNTCKTKSRKRFYVYMILSM